MRLGDGQDEPVIYGCLTDDIVSFEKAKEIISIY
jgi:hypothetical protein